MVVGQLNLPSDIPWKRMGVSGDMIDTKGGDLKFPKKQISSISVFYHEPTELPPEYGDRSIAYLKVVCTLANYQPDGQDVTVLDQFDRKKEFIVGSHDFEETVTTSFPCYGALIQVGVYPSTPPTTGIHDWPYIARFQPQKREMFENMTQSGEVASQSGSNLNVLKGTTNTESTEEYALDLGGESGNASILWGALAGGGTDLLKSRLEQYLVMAWRNRI